MMYGKFHKRDMWWKFHSIAKLGFAQLKSLKSNSQWNQTQTNKVSMLNLNIIFVKWNFPSHNFNSYLKDILWHYFGWNVLQWNGVTILDLELSNAATGVGIFGSQGNNPPPPPPGLVPRHTNLPGSYEPHLEETRMEDTSTREEDVCCEFLLPRTVEGKRIQPVRKTWSE